MQITINTAAILFLISVNGSSMVGCHMNHLISQKAGAPLLFVEFSPLLFEINFILFQTIKWENFANSVFE